MINNIQKQLLNPVVSPANSLNSKSSAASSSTSFADELGSQISLPDIRTIFESSTANTTTTAAATTAGSGSAATTASSAAPTSTAAAPAGPTAVPTAQSVFGDQPWMDNPQGTGPDNSSWNYNPMYFATDATAQKIADMVGGTVVQQNVMTPAAGSPLQQSQMNEMVQLKDGSVVNPGLIAGFYDHGYSESMVDQMIQNEIKGV